MSDKLQVNCQSAGAGPRDETLAAFMEEARAALGSAGDPFHHSRQGLEDLAGRLQTETFHLAVLGQFKRGKSTLLNALLGKEILPTSVVPLTAIPTFVRWGSASSVKVTFDQDRDALTLPAAGEAELSEILSAYVTEENNPENRLGVLQVDVALNEPLLSRGLVIIDTPGIGSTYQHNTETTLNFLPQCDAALFLVSADPPVTEVELKFLAEVRRIVPHLVFVFNKVDYLREGDREKAVDFFRQVLARQAGFPEKVPVFPLSALHGLDGCLAGDEEIVAESGLGALSRHLMDFLVSEKSRVLERAVARKAADIVAEALMQIQLTIRSLSMPIENLEQRLETLEEKIGQAMRERETAGDLLAGDRKRAVALLEQQAGQLRERARKHMGNVVSGAITAAPAGSSLESRARTALDEAIPGFFERELGLLSREFGRHLDEVLEPHRERADRLISAVRAAASELFEIPFSAPQSGGTYEPTSQPYWITRKWNSSLSPVPMGLMDFLLTAGLKRAVVMKRIMRQVDDLVVHNVENLRWATRQNLDDAFRRFAGALDSRMADTVEATRGAIEAVLGQRRQHTDAADRRLPSLKELTARLDQIKSRMETAASPLEET